MNTRLVIFVSNDQIVQLTGVADPSGTPISTATILGTLFDKRGTGVPGFMNVTFTPATTPGGYNATIPNTFAPPIGSYTLQLNGTTTGGIFTVYVETDVQRRTL